ncbi:MAG: TetR/AcrR family transcriptional regulator [Actinomycetota bacterium]|nr:TetR/AcrR family transcriptional regulator [Actinomycetota bacterium]
MSSTDVDAPVAGGPGATRTRDDVVAAAGRLFAQRGFHGTSMRDLGEELGMLGSSLYSHVQGKNELLVEVIGRGAEFFNGVVTDATMADGPAVDELRHLVYGHVHVVVEHIDEARTFLFESRFLPEADRLKIVAMRDAYEEAYRSAIERAEEEGSLVQGIDARMTAIFILSVLNALIRWYRPSGKRQPADIAEEMWAFIAGGILAGDTR